MSARAKDPLTEAINAAVKAAFAEHVTPLMKELKKPTSEPPPKATVDGERFVSMNELGARLGVTSRTIRRRERAGKLPKRRTFPDGSVGWTASDINRWFESAIEGENQERNAELAARIHH